MFSTDHSRMYAALKCIEVELKKQNPEMDRIREIMKEVGRDRPKKDEKMVERDELVFYDCPECHIRWTNSDEIATTQYGGKKVCMECKETQKPPIGIKPEIFYKEQRLRDLAFAINNYIHQGFFSGNYAVTIEIWCDELSRRLREFR